MLGCLTDPHRGRNNGVPGRRMETSRQGDVTGLLVAWKNGSPEALDELIPIVYAELRNLARLQLRVLPQSSVGGQAITHLRARV